MAQNKRRAIIVAAEIILFLYATGWALALLGYRLPRLFPLKPPREKIALISDNHAESFFWFAEKLDAQEDYTLILFDEHNDASAVADSDVIRKALRAPVILGTRDRLFTELRKRSVIQCYNWVEPLMPTPLSKVLWIAASHASRAELEQKRLAIKPFIDFFETSIPRRRGSLHDRIEVIDREELQKRDLRNQKLVVTIDLDYFRSLDLEQLRPEMELVFQWLSKQENLYALSLAVSRPYQNDEQQARRILLAALQHLSAKDIVKSLVLNEGTVAVDNSLKQGEFAARGEPLPQFHFRDLGPEFSAALSAFQSTAISSGP